MNYSKTLSVISICINITIAECFKLGTQRPAPIELMLQWTRQIINL